ncbi:alanine racemase [Dongia deserti]|uniref:alanine racemase n=1 Tax=Dongia deserti TaxID=2268030 RepID=UPI000E65BF95|nr:alanine racemase [Dongia deserti]
MSLTTGFLNGSIGPGFDADAMRAALEELDRQAIDPLTKGFPPAHAALAPGDIGEQSWNLLAGDLPAPVAVLRKSALEHNARWMRHLLDKFGLQLAPHAKTTMTPHLWAQQAANGCWGLTVATVQQAEVAVAYGCRNLLIANQVTGRAQVRGIVALNHAHEDLAIHVLVDSLAGLKALSADVAHANTEQPINVLIEIGFEGGRTGCRTLEQVSQLLDELPTHQGRVRLAGIAGYEGMIATATGAEDGPRAEAYFDRFAEAAQLADRRNAFITDEVILTAGGSAYYDIVGRRLSRITLDKPTVKILRSGCYVTHDCGTYVEHLEEMQRRDPAVAKDLGLLEPALFVCCLVQSVPEPGLALLTMGKRDVGFDLHLPQPVWRYRTHATPQPEPTPKEWRITKLNDQHAYLSVPANADIAVGDLICCGISHPCTTFDRWRVIHVVDDGWTSLGAVPTFF